MSTLTIDITELRNKTVNGKKLSEKNAVEKEKSERQRFKNEVDRCFNNLLPSILKSVDEEASDGKNHYYFMILDSSWKKEQWKNKRYVYNDVRSRQNLKLNFPFPFGVLKKKEKVRNFDSYRFESDVMWACTKKIALYFLRKRFTVLLGEREVMVNSDFQERNHYTTSHFEISCLEICW